MKEMYTKKKYESLCSKTVHLSDFNYSYDLTIILVMEGNESEGREAKGKGGR